MATGNAYLPTPTKTPLSTSSSSLSRKQHNPNSTTTSSSSSRFEAYNRLQAAAVAFGEKFPIPEIVALGGQSDGKSSLLEALLGFRFNVCEVEMGTRRPLILQMVHDPNAPEPRCRFQPCCVSHNNCRYYKITYRGTLKRTKAAVSSKSIVMRAEYAHCPNLTIIDTPGFVLKAKKGEPEKTPEAILSMVKSLASPPHRILLFLQQSSLEWCSSLWLDAIREIDPTFRRTIIVVSKFDNRLKEFSDRWEVDHYLSANGYLGKSTRPFFVALPKDRSTISNDEFRRQISQVDSEILRRLCEGIKGGFDEEKFGTNICFSSLRVYLESELQKRYKEAAPATLALLAQRCSQVANILLAHAGQGEGRGVTEAAAEIARAAARSWLAPLLDTACDRLAFVLGNHFDLAVERNNIRDSEYAKQSGNLDGCVGFFPSLRPAYNRFIKDLAKQCKQLVRHHLDSVTSPYSQVCYENDFQGGFGLGETSIFKLNQASARSFYRDQENISPEKNVQQTTPRKVAEAREALKESQMTVPETPSPDQPCDMVYGGAKKEHGNCIEIGPRKRISRMTGNSRNTEHLRAQNGGGLLFGNGDSGLRSCSAYSEICLSATQHFGRIREVLVERSVMSTLNFGFLTPCQDKLVVALGLDLFAVSDEKFMDMFVAPGAIDVLQDERQSLHKVRKYSSRA
ncbi:hypothetical protein P3X46_006847 [Hevea brasiliensis]|uniref:Dynamin-type G domain-containing protein n=1 Tax=Hevea brasiliensis TaxID=3981 RepID=A0ABQ9MRJ3_HEVBR|nr:hypothetical protein P3X46_006847 [Hevea brasiliensis]